MSVSAAGTPGRAGGLVPGSVAVRAKPQSRAAGAVPSAQQSPFIADTSPAQVLSAQMKEGEQLDVRL